jgi:2-polyprenyl-3-methyl-5-hydroxy-6-metoxy-1,4-benzoquinol methylase
MPNPGIIFEAINSYQNTAALKAGVELGIFTAIAQGASTAAEIGERCQASARGTRILADYLTILGFLRKEGDRYSLSRTAAVFLVADSPSYMGGTLKFLLSDYVMNAFSDLATTVRNGRTILRGQGTVEPDNEVWREFARAMVPLMMPAAQFLASHAPREGALKVLDIAAGHGMFGIHCALRNPEAQIYALDWPAVLDVAGENARKKGVADRVHRIEGDAFTVDLGSDYDIVLIPNFLHHFDEPTNVTFLKRVHAALKPGGRVLTLEFVPNEDRVTPANQATFALMMLGTTASGDAFTFSELSRMASAAGFARSEWMDVPQSPERLVISYK